MPAKERVLIVDDEKNIVSSLQNILADEGYEVSTAEDGLDALDMIQSDPPDLVLLDIWLPGMDGIEVLKTVKTYYPEIEVLVMSGHGTIDTAVKATKLGAADFIEKPFSLDHLTRSVEKALKQRKKSAPGDKDSPLRSPIPFCFETMVGVKKAIKNAARSAKPVLVLGESGTGKELVVQAIHRQSKKHDRPIIKLNCAVRPMPSVQAQLFSPAKKGIGSISKTPGLTRTGERAVYLTHIEFLSKGLQEKLALALKPDGAKKAEPEFLPARLYASSTKDLETLARKGQFHKGLLEILQAVTVEIPPLRQYADHIPALIKTYFAEYVEDGGGVTPEFDAEAMAALCGYPWPGNIKELRSALEQAMVTASSREKISLQDLPAPIRRNSGITEAADAAPDIEIAGAAARTPGGLTRQRTLKRSVVLCGSGLHSGIKTGLILQPLPPGSGIIFGDIASGVTIPAHLENIQSTEYATCLSKGSTSVATIEHIMAALHMYRITNLLIKIGDEAPVMDGSAKDFCQLIDDGEFEEQDAWCDEIIIDRLYTFGAKDGAFISIEPADTLTVSYYMDYPEPLGKQDFTYVFSGPESFKREIAPARTFGFLKDMAHLNKMGFGTGGKLDNFILLGDGKVLNTKLRYDNECVRHKILDILGDFYLLGKPIRGRIKAHKSGHTQNIGLLTKIKESLAALQVTA